MIVSEEKSCQSHLIRQWHLAMNFGSHHAYVRVGFSIPSRDLIANSSTDARHFGDEVERFWAT